MQIGYWVSKSGRKSVVHLVSEDGHPDCGALPSGVYCPVGNGVHVGEVTCLRCKRVAVELARLGTPMGRRGR